MKIKIEELAINTYIVIKETYISFRFCFFKNKI